MSIYIDGRSTWHFIIKIMMKYTNILHYLRKNVFIHHLFDDEQNYCVYYFTFLGEFHLKNLRINGINIHESRIFGVVHKMVG